MKSKLSKAGLVSLGLVGGILISLQLSAVAERSAAPLPIDELRSFTEVYGRVKNDYVEAVDDKELIEEAINGMLSGLDPQSAATALRSVATTGAAGLAASISQRCSGSVIGRA